MGRVVPLPAIVRQAQREERLRLEYTFRTLYCQHLGVTRSEFDAAWFHGLGPEGGDVKDRQLARPRRHVWDFVHRTLPLCVEVNGGQARGSRSGHGSWTGLARDAEKAQLAMLQGYWPWTVTTSMLKPEDSPATFERLGTMLRDLDPGRFDAPLDARPDPHL